MSESYSFLGLAKKLIEEEKRPLTVGEIWTLANQRGYASRLRQLSKPNPGKTPRNTLSAMLGDEIRRRGDASTFVRLKDPRGRIRYFLRAAG